jgi:predicted amidohydrolase/adenosylcobinamide amidohydrolase
MTPWPHELAMTVPRKIPISAYRPGRAPLRTPAWLGLLAGLALALLFTSAAAFAAGAAPDSPLALPAAVDAEARIVRAEREGLWEKTLLVTFPQSRRTLSTFDGLVDARAAINHAAHPWLWERVSRTFMRADGRGGQAYIEHVRALTAARLGLEPGGVVQMATAADLDNLAVATREFGPLTVTALVTAGARSNALRAGVDAGTHIEGMDSAAANHGTINIMLLTNARLTDGAMARAMVTATEAKTAALQDLNVPSTYTPAAQATGTGTDSVIVVSGTSGPQATSAGGHSRLGELIGRATHAAVVEALGKQNGFFLPGAKKVPGERHAAGKAPGAIRIALLHMDSVPGDVAANRARIEAGIAEAVRGGADWVTTPELAETGYNFASRIGTDWIAPFPSAWVSTLAAIARDNGVALFVGVAERDAKSGRLHNSVAVIDRAGSILGTYRKQLVVHGSAEAWSQPGADTPPFVVDGVPVGVLICADAWSPDYAARHRERGAAILLSPANWPPVGDMGPKTTWEDRSRETGLPLVVNNRTGSEPELDFSQGQSAVSAGGRRLLSFSSPQSRVFYVDWDGREGFSAPGP